jgi:hypothetical protein
MNMKMRKNGKTTKTFLIKKDEWVEQISEGGM